MSTTNNRQRSVNDRIRVAAQASGVDANRVRRSLVFQRLLVRVAPFGLVLKGGYCLEARLPGAVRATKDVDLVGRVAMADDPDSLLDALEPMLDAGPDDGFTFRAGVPQRLRDGTVEHHAWRIKVQVFLDRAPFEVVTVDLVGQVAEVEGGTEPLMVPPPVAIAGCEPVVVQAVDVYQHAAEKYHAYARIYAQEQPSSRVKDLVDLVLLIESGLIDDTTRLGTRLARVHAERDSATPPVTLSPPPGSWIDPYAAMAADLDLTASVLAAAHLLVADRYAAALTEGTTP